MSTTDSPERIRYLTINYERLHGLRLVAVGLSVTVAGLVQWTGKEVVPCRN